MELLTFRIQNIVFFLSTKQFAYNIGIYVFFYFIIAVCLSVCWLFVCNSIFQQQQQQFNQQSHCYFEATIVWCSELNCMYMITLSLWPSCCFFFSLQMGIVEFCEKLLCATWHIYTVMIAFGKRPQGKMKTSEQASVEKIIWKLVTFWSNY